MARLPLGPFADRKAQSTSAGERSGFASARQFWKAWNCLHGEPPSRMSSGGVKAPVCGDAEPQLQKEPLAWCSRQDRCTPNNGRSK
jgi:hypothetical protein